MKRPKLTSEKLKILQEEADRRAQHRTNKELAQMTGLAPMYVANLVSKLRRGVSVSVDVSCETGGNVNT
jgi:DNA-binding Lrp family transcriptional regulator